MPLCRFSGTGDVMGGSLVLCSSSPLYADLAQWQRLRYEDLLYDEDAAVLERNSRDLTQRMERVNRSTQQIVRWLAQQPQVHRLYTPYTAPSHWGEERVQPTQPEAAAAASPPALHPALKASACPGFGGLFSLVLRFPERTSAAFYDSVRVSKGPSLGNNFSLLCPYTLLAHYAELDWAESAGVHRFLLRFSVGLEEPDELQARLAQALLSIQPIIAEEEERQAQQQQPGSAAVASPPVSGSAAAGAAQAEAGTQQRRLQAHTV